jgi:hypothetical protein
MKRRARTLPAQGVTAPADQRFVKAEKSPGDAVEKYNWIREIAEVNGFRAPRAELVYRDGSEFVSLDFMPDFLPLRRLYIRYLIGLSTNPQFLSVMRDVGRILAAIHNARIPPDWKLYRMAPELRTEARRYGLRSDTDTSPVPLHGDFGQMNVGVSAASGEVVVLDPCANIDTPIEGHLVYGDPAVDLGLMLGFLEGQVHSPAILLATRPRVCKAQAAFLEGYLGGGRKIDLESAFAYSNAFFCFRMQKLGPLRRLSTRLLYNSIRGNSTVQDKVACIQRYLNV